MLVINATVYPEGSFVAPLCVRMDGGRVQQVSPTLSPLPGEEVLDLAGDYLLPGFVDVHIHGYRGCDTMQGEAAIRAMSRALYREGVAAFLPTTMSASPEETLHAIAGVRAVMASPEPVGAQVLGVHMEAPFLSPLRAGAQRKEHFCAPDMETLRSLTGGSLQGIRLLTLAPELEGSEFLIPAACEAGITVSLGHTCATAEETHLAADRGATHVTHTFNAQTPLNHREPGVPGAALTDDRLYCEVIADGIHLHGDAVRLLVRAKGADRAVAVTDAMEAAGMPEGSYRLGGSRVLVKDGQARLEDGTLAGSVLTMGQALENLIHRFGILPEDAVRMCTLTPARSIGERLAGRICPGAPVPLTRWTKDWRMMGIVDQAFPACNRAANRL
ncbi:MAG: N-acetylglucosamine-6-phosphate deacetylase [Clostridia bacterium]|nr:N-acetylglucosamine-6-phosphate deacetylase [Clostridia bacterium]